ncbi:MAG TPA: hypothetical protein VLG12_07020 [Candidatus Saccharimonadales bacterium]|nr:hypothetical protein [Candidatus Saccharimonadales bacterium]
MVAPRILPVEQIKQALESACQFCSPTDLPVLKELKDESFITLAFSFATIYTEPSAMPASNRIEAVLSACRSEGLKMQQDDIQLENLDEQLAAIFAEAIK